MSWTTAVTDLRTLLSDGAKDRYAYRKKCFGSVDGTNAMFKTLEFRRVSDFTDANSASPLGVYVSGVRVATADVSSDDIASGEFTLALPPTPDQSVEATYYYRWFIDTELETFLTAASEWLGLSTDYAQIPEGLRPSAKYYAAQEAMHKMAARWVERLSEQYLVEDAPDHKNMGVAGTYRQLAEDYKKKSVELRDQYYTRQGQSLAPLYGNNFGSVREVTPRR
jgi:hypothetical protein